MPLPLTAAQVQALAPDASSAAAAKKLAKPGPWRNVGQSELALWGECQGSAVYQTQVALTDLSSKCSCPSRKFPCKHALALLLWAVDGSAALPERSPPEWVASWLEKRAAVQEKKLSREPAEPKAGAGGAQKKSAEKRHERVLLGLEQLDAFLSDLVRQGLGRLNGESPAFWDAQARRLVDAQAPGLAARVRQLGMQVGVGSEWPTRLLEQLGQLALLTHAYRRLHQLEPKLAADVRRSVGMSLEQAEVVAHGDVVADQWDVLGVFLEDEERVRMQRAWLHGRQSGRSALVLQFAVGNAGFAQLMLPGTSFRGQLAFWPSGAPQRALVVTREQVEAAPPPACACDVARALDDFAELLAGCPWLERAFFVLRDVRFVPGEPSRVLDMEGAALPLTGCDDALLLAVGGGHPLTLAGEWDGYALRPLCTWVSDRALVLSGVAR